MKTTRLILIMLACGISCARTYASPAEPARPMLERALEKHLARQGDICVGKPAWPIAVSEQDAASQSRDAVQMPVLEKLGLALSAKEYVRRGEGDGAETVAITYYSLTKAGKKYYRSRAMPVVADAAGGAKKMTRQNDFCVGKLSLDKVVQWDKPAVAGKNPETVATYTYKVAAAEWIGDPDAQKAFPMVDRIVKGAGTMQMKQRFRLTNKGWTPVSPFE